MTPVTPDPIKAKIDELDRKINTTSFLMFSYIQAVLNLLTEKELLNAEEFEEYLNKSREELSKMMQDAQFLDAMKDFLPKDGDDKGE